MQITLHDTYQCRTGVYYGDGMIDGYCRYINSVSTKRVRKTRRVFLTAMDSGLLSRRENGKSIKLVITSRPHGLISKSFSELCDVCECVAFPVNFSAHWALAVLAKDQNGASSITLTWNDSMNGTAHLPFRNGVQEELRSAGKKLVMTRYASCPRQSAVSTVVSLSAGTWRRSLYPQR